MPKIAVFGTLKKDYCNNWRMKGEYLGPGRTKDKMALDYLCLWDTREVAQVVIDLYEMTEEDIQKYVDPIELHAYDRKKKMVILDKDDSEHEADMYISFPKWDKGLHDKNRNAAGFFNYVESFRDNYFY